MTQRYFDDGLLLIYGFNHAAALRSFQLATHYDPECAMCYWGIAYTFERGIPANQELAGILSAGEAIQTAVVLSQDASASEQAYIQALAQRYASATDRAALNLTYANAMRQVANQYPEDPDAATLLAEALMDTSPWNYWETTGELNLVGQEIVTVLKSVLQRHPNYPGALHFYIHAVEEKHPEWAIAEADRLRNLHLPIGHLVHMPSHIYVRVGRYQDAVLVNQEAIAIDEQASHANEGIYTDALLPHNYHFLWSAATLAGQPAIALQAARQAGALANPHLLRQPGYGMLQHFLSLPLYTFVQFEQWQAILAEPAPAPDLLYPTGIWHYARGMAFVATDRLSDATTELETLRTIAENPALENVTLWETNKTTDLLQIGAAVLAGELAAAQGRFESAVRYLNHAVELEDSLRYDEPPAWHSPTRRSRTKIIQKAKDKASTSTHPPLASDRAA